MRYRGGPRGTRWGAVALGWSLAVLLGAVITPILRLLYRLLVEAPAGRGEVTAATVVVSVVSGFLAFLAGGFVAASLAGRAGGRHGALTAVFGLAVGLVLAGVLGLSGNVFAEGVAVPPASFGLAGVALLAGLALFLVDLFGGYVGGKLGEPSVTPLEQDPGSEARGRAAGRTREKR